MSISGISKAYGSELQSLLLSALKDQPKAAGQDVPSGDQTAPPAGAQGAAPAPPAGSTQLASATLSVLIYAQQPEQHHHQSPSDLANQLLGKLDKDGDGALSLDEIKSALSGKGQGLDDRIDAAVKQLDTNGDGKLDASELQAGLQNLRGHHGHHHHYAYGQQPPQTPPSTDPAAPPAGSPAPPTAQT